MTQRSPFRGSTWFRARAQKPEETELETRVVDVRTFSTNTRAGFMDDVSNEELNSDPSKLQALLEAVKEDGGVGAPTLRYVQWVRQFGDHFGIMISDEGNLVTPTLNPNGIDITDQVLLENLTVMVEHLRHAQGAMTLPVTLTVERESKPLVQYAASDNAELGFYRDGHQEFQPWAYGTFPEMLAAAVKL